ncbi:MAG: NAD(P)/FAD-dependent oxidoreductase, partial [Bradymonadia bacterium]
MLRRYFNWLHGKWPARQIESLPVLDANFETSQPGLFVVGDLTGIPLLKFAADSAARVVDHISTRPRSSGSKQYDLVIIGGGVSGISAAIEAKRKNLSFIVLESDRPLSTIENFPLAKPILTYPRNMVPTGGLRIEGHTRETLLDSLRAQAAPIKDAFLSGTAEQIERTSEGFAVHLVPVEDDTPAPLSARFVVIAIGRSGQYETLGVPGEEL